MMRVIPFNKTFESRYADEYPLNVETIPIPEENIHYPSVTMFFHDG